MKKNISRNPLWPDWYNGKKIDEVQFGRAFLEQWPLKCVNGTLYTLDGPVEDESEIKQRILENIEEYVTSGLSKKVTNILETIKLLAFSDPFPIEQDCIHLQNGVYHLPDGSFQESRLFCQNRLPVRYDPKAASPDRWLTFLHELLDDADIPTLQEYLGYCLIPSTKGQKMMLIVGKGGEGKSRIGLVLKRLMGDAASNGSVQKVENNRFARADLERRLLMIDDDMDMNALPKTNYIKTIVTAEAKLDLERKGVQSYQRDIYARFLCFGNGALTSLYDHSDGFFRSRRTESDFRHRQTAVRQRLAQRHSVVRIINSNDRHEASQRQLLQKFHDTSSFLCGLTRACKRLQAVMRMKEGSLPYPLDAHELNQYHHTTFSVFRQGKMQHFAHFSRKKRADGAKGRVRSILRNNAKHGIIKSA